MSNVPSFLTVFSVAGTGHGAGAGVKAEGVTGAAAGACSDDIACVVASFAGAGNGAGAGKGAAAIFTLPLAAAPFPGVAATDAAKVAALKETCLFPGVGERVGADADADSSKGPPSPPPSPPPPGSIAAPIS